MSKRTKGAVKNQQWDTLERSEAGNNMMIDLQKELLDKEILLSLNNDIASIKDKKDILKVIHPKLSQLFNTEDIFICVVDKSTDTLDPFLRVCSAERIKYPEYESSMNSKFPIHDGFIDKILNSVKPIVFDIIEVCDWPTPPQFMKISKAAGIVESLSKSLHHGDDILGIITLWADKRNSFTQHHKNLLEKVADLVSIAVTNILASEALMQRDKENETLLEISNEFAAIRNKDDLTRILTVTLKNYIPFDDSVITLYNKERNTYSIYAYHLEEKRLSHPQIEAALKYEYPISDNNLSNSHTPVVANVESLFNKGVQQVKFIYDAGINEYATIKLVDGQTLIGLFVLLSEKKNSFTARSLYIMQRISYQISIAVAKLLAIDELRNREMEKEILLTIGSELSAVRNKEDLLPILKRQLENLSFYSDVTIAKVDNGNKTFSGFLVNEENTIRLSDKDYPQMKNAHHPFPDGVFEVALHSKKPVIFDIEKIVTEGTAPSYVQFIYKNGSIDMAGISLRDRNREIGALFLFSDKKQIFTDTQLSLVQGIGNQLGTVVANILANEEIRMRENEKSILLKLSSEIASVRNKEDLFNIIRCNLKELFAMQGFAIAIVNEDKKTHSAYLYDLEETISTHSDFKELLSQNFEIEDGVFNQVIIADEPVAINVHELSSETETPLYVSFWKKMGIPLIVGIPLRVGENNLGCLFFHIDPNLVHNISNSLLKGVCAQISTALSNILANEKISRQLEEINRYRQQLEEEKQYLQEEISSGYTYSDIIGSGPEMQRVFHQLSQVSFADSTVLLLGETGTGKELVARAIHNSSPRREKLMVKVNCAAMPPNLIESELFGHERGSFTGATDRRIGKFELANNGTLFLDEIGEMPAELQVKLLRAIQEREIERVGGKSTIKVNVRIIAATNRDLQQEVDEGRFRRDLFYRLNVFPIMLPALRERIKDIPVLVSHFLNKYSKTTGNPVKDVSSKVMKQLMAYEWPGNVRELEHLIERTLLTTNSRTIKEVHLPLNNKLELKAALEDEYLKTYEENERDHIIRVLNKCDGKIFGPGGAAEILQLPTSTLNSKIKKLGIKKNKMYS